VQPAIFYVGPKNVEGTYIDVFIIFSLPTTLSFLGSASVVIIRVFSLPQDLFIELLYIVAFGILH
jgi:hypothetical protein